MDFVQCTRKTFHRQHYVHIGLLAGQSEDSPCYRLRLLFVSNDSRGSGQLHWPSLQKRVNLNLDGRSDRHCTSYVGRSATVFWMSPLKSSGRLSNNSVNILRSLSFISPVDDCIPFGFTTNAGPVFRSFKLCMYRARIVWSRSELELQTSSRTRRTASGPKCCLTWCSPLTRPNNGITSWELVRKMHT